MADLDGCFLKLVGCGALVVSAAVTGVVLPAGTVETGTHLLDWIRGRRDEASTALKEIGRDLSVAARAEGLDEDEVARRIERLTSVLMEFRPPLDTIVAVYRERGRDQAHGDDIAVEVRLATLVADAAPRDRFDEGFTPTYAVQHLTAVFAKLLAVRSFFEKLSPDFARGAAIALGRIEAKQDRIGDNIADIKASFVALLTRLGSPRTAEQEIERLEREQSATAPEVLGLLKAILEQDPDPARLDEMFAAAHKALGQTRQELEHLRSLANEVPEIEADLAAARAAIENKEIVDLAAAQTAIRAARDRYRETRRRRKEQEDINEARLAEGEAVIALARARYLEAAELFRQAADICPASETLTRWGYQLRRADALNEHGRIFPGLHRLAEGISVLRDEALPLVKKDERPAEWAGTQNNLAVALSDLGERAGQGRPRPPRPRRRSLRGGGDRLHPR